MIAFLAVGLTVTLAQPFAPGQGVLPSGVDCGLRIFLRLTDWTCMLGQLRLVEISGRFTSRVVS